MSGRHARAADQSASEAWLSDVIVLVAVPCLLGLMIYLVVAGYDAAFYALLVLVWVPVTVRSLVRRKRQEWFMVWAAPGQVFLWTDSLARSLSARHMWLARDRHVLMLISHGTEWAGFTCTAIAVIVGIKSGELLWFRRGSRPATDEPG